MQRSGGILANFWHGKKFSNRQRAQVNSKPLPERIIGHPGIFAVFWYRCLAKILLIEDDPAVRKLVSDWLEFEHHVVEIAEDGAEGSYKSLTFQYDLLVIDIDLPKKNGFEICEEYRSSGGESAILMLTGRDRIENKEQGFSLGADDYLTKPFHIKELSARVKALLRRSRSVTQKEFTWRDVLIDPTSFSATKAGVEVKLLPKEFALLEFLMKNPNQVFTAEALLNRIWASESDTTTEAITTCVSRIRKKLDTSGQTSIIRTVHGVGYKFEVEKV